MSDCVDISTRVGAVVRSDSTALRELTSVNRAMSVHMGEKSAERLSDAELISRSLSHPSMFAEIFDRHVRAVHRYLARRTSANAADELVADVFVIAFEQRQRYDPLADSAAPWLFGIARNLVSRWYRSKSRRDRAFERLLSRSTIDVGDPLDDVVDALDAQRLAQPLGQALDAIAEADREALLLFAWENLTYEQIAQTQGVPIGTVRSRMFRARRILRELVEPAGQLPSDMTQGGNR